MLELDFLDFFSLSWPCSFLATKTVFCTIFFKTFFQLIESALLIRIKKAAICGRPAVVFLSMFTGCSFEDNRAKKLVDG